MGIAKYGYTGFYYPKSFAFSPFYPFLINSLTFVTEDVVLSAVLITLVFGVAWAVAFTRMAEFYMPRHDAVGTALFAAFFPMIFFLTTIAYSE
jgi:hypothetical protein